MRTGVLAEAHQRLFKIREALHGRRPISGLEDLHGSTLKWADGALAEADATKDVDQRLAQLREAYHSLREAHALTLHGEDPDAVCDYLDKCLAEAEADAAADRAHFSAVSSNQSVQKLYVAPEWMFRRSAGAPYSTAEFKRIAARVTAISNKYPDWLIIPGTVYYGEPIGDGKFFVRNEALVAHAGDLRVVSKQHEQDAMAANEVWYPRPNESTRFKAGGHTYAVEICRDHYKAIAAEESDDLVDFHVITSNGVAVAPHAVAARDGGLVVHVDGQFGATTVYRVQWRENPNAGEAKEFRERARAMRREITALDIEWTAGNAEASKLQAQISQRKAKMRQQGKFNKDDATLKRLEKQREELDDAGCNIMLRQKAVSNKLNAEAAKFLELAPISGGDGIQIPENLLELDRDRYA
ncbi:hypothetical protein [Nannocystis bainbridge]|uniref:Uncharacterized protein n=1 Tax=Nannocystis bainbridge TaxID=2995303 RepID=A0ABT5EDF0_9BACT|nr:hypothetical protein [Nannocystis bainbridge]MDC0723585.1 hypothetical protein [Nannocystis bainbridge]